MENFTTEYSFALELDANDPLSDYRNQFHIPRNKDGQEVIYFCGHSLGLQPKTVSSFTEQVLSDWAKLGVAGHFKAERPWLNYLNPLSEQTAKLVGAHPYEVTIMNALTVNLHLMMVSFYRPTRERYKIVMEEKAFPSDQYAVKSHIQFHGFDPADAFIELSPRTGEQVIRTDDIAEFIARHGQSIALIMLGGINYYSGQVFDMDEITRLGQKQGCVVGFDLAHAIGNVPLKLHDWQVDFAVWCSYKYLNAGPGSPGGCFVHEKNSRRSDLPRFAGWWGHNSQTRFLMQPAFEAIPGAKGWQISNPPILSLSPLLASMEIFEEVGLERLRTKSQKLAAYLEFLINQQSDENISIITPYDANQRGCQLSIRVNQNGKSLFEKLSRHDVICDWREPDVIRVAPVPLYNKFSEVYQFVELFNRLQKEISYPTRLNRNQKVNY